ncbi:ATPase [Thermoplasma sp. Kam2015]|nr:ATPase [Thermoplasma sp. Kam2015]
MKDVQESEYEIGYTVGDNRSESFTFVVDPEIQIKKWEYVYIKAYDDIVLGRVDDLVSKSDLLNDRIDFNSVRKYSENRMNENVDICIVRIIGSVRDGKIARSRYLIRPGQPVYKAKREILESILKFDDDRSLFLGHLADQPDVRVFANINGLRRHLAIIAQTGAGKSHTAGVIMEELLKKGASIIVLDPHADYVLMKNSQNPIYRDGIRVFRTPMSTGRYTDRLGKVDDFTIRFQDLNYEEVCEIMGIHENYVQQSNVVKKIMENLKGRKDVDEFIEKSDSIDLEHRIAPRIKYLKRIKSIFGNRTTDIGEYLAPARMSVIDLSGLDQGLANYFAYRVISQVYDAKTTGSFEYPVFLFIEEAHNFAPPEKNRGNGASRLLYDLVKKIAAEGRKFGIFLAIITQRPGKIDQDVLSQCNSQIILRITNPVDQKAILESSENMSASLMEDLPSLDIGEAIIIGEIVKMPTIAKIRQRETEEGGVDVEITEMLRKAREEAAKQRDPSTLIERTRKLVE